MGKAAALEKAKNPTAAAAVLEAISGEYTQDYRLFLRLAWLHFQAANYPEAARNYRRTLSLSSSCDEARQGLAWTLLRQGKREEAHSIFEAVLASSPGHASARQGSKLSEPPPTVVLSPSISTSFQGYQDHPQKSWGLSFTLSLPLLIKDRFWIGLDYRHSYFAGLDYVGTGPGWRSLPLEFEGQDSSQNEGYLSLGVVRPRFGILGHYAFIEDNIDMLDHVHVAGLSGRYSAWGDILAEGSVTFYDDMQVYRIAPAWRLPLNKWLTITPSVAVQLASADGESDQLESQTEALVTGTINVTLVGSPGSVWVGGKFGDEVRPTFLSVPAVYNIPDRIDFGVWTGGRLALGTSWYLHASYCLEQMELRDADSRYTSYVHSANLGVGWSSK